MKRYLSVIMLIAAFWISSACFSVSASAFWRATKIWDDADCFTAEEEEELYRLLEQAADRADINIAVVTTDDLSDTTPEAYAKHMFNMIFLSDSDSMVLLIQTDFDNEDAYDYIEMSGKAYSKYYSQLDEIFDAYYAGKASGGYADGIKNFCGFFTGSYTPAGQDGAAASGQEQTYKAILADYDGVLTDTEEVYLLSAMQEAVDDIECSIGVVITSDRGGLTPKQYADNFAEEKFGYGSDNIVLLFDNDKVSPNHKDWISTSGVAERRYDGYIDSIFNYLYVGFDSNGGNNYSQGIQSFCSYLRNTEFYAEDDSYEYDDYYYDEDGGIVYYTDDVSVMITLYAIPALIALAMTIFSMVVTVKGYSKKAPVSAARYMDSSRTKFKQRKDKFLREVTTHVRISSDSGGHSGGGGSSGGHGGGGGRSR